MAHRHFGQLGFAQGGHGVPVKFFTGFGHAETARGSTQQAHAQLAFQLLHAVAERRFWHAEIITGGSKSSPIDDIHKNKKIVQVQSAHARSNPTKTGHDSEGLYGGRPDLIHVCTFISPAGPHLEYLRAGFSYYACGAFCSWGVFARMVAICSNPPAIAIFFNNSLNCI